MKLRPSVATALPTATLKPARQTSQTPRFALAGVLSSQAYSAQESKEEASIRRLADKLYRRVDWTWATSRNRPPLLSMGWTPEQGFLENYRTEHVWRLMRSRPYVRTGLVRAGFTGGWLDPSPQTITAR